jgi:hypothetical protein
MRQLPSYGVGRQELSMRKGLLGSIAALAISATQAIAQPPAQYPPSGPGNPGLASLPPGPDMSGSPDGPPGLFNQPPGDNGIPRSWFSAATDVLFIRPMTSPYPLVTSGTVAAGGTFPNIGTTTLFGAQNFHYGPEIGGQFNYGSWFQNAPNWGWDWSGFVLENKVLHYHVDAADQVITRPFIDADTGLPNSFLVAFPGFDTGNLTASVSTQLWGLEWNLMRRLAYNPNMSLNFLFGFRYWDLHENLSISSTSDFLVASTFYGLPIAAGSKDTVADSFDTRNQYMTGQLGFSGDWYYKRWTVSWASKLALGAVYETSLISGASTLYPTAAAAGNTVQGGLLALDSNIGRHHTSQFVVVPDEKIQVNYRFFKNIDLGIAYNFTYFSRVLRPADQIDPMLSTTHIPTSTAFSVPGGVFMPVATANQSDFWLQGVTFSFTAHW